ncbi:hypothetical protein C475_03319 [Halosimplex carlsbadense 2-9-1]|uniref:Uncharacterized protein n=1 Tax=Halosimplex carlsbadense 2-9-1 TaxID=797114 RepID=M0D4W0_9EURY|nr:hypothetical protein [Halosimplex carlsbadense]ELZ29214.1 hypothetical protein C475_03319 [Halosimplex carlsbadense 2-9-1]
MTQSLTQRQWGTLLIVVGFALLVNPFVVGALDIGDPDSYTYEPGRVTFYDNGTYDAADPADVIDPKVACLDDQLPTRSCMLERAVHANDGVVYDGLPQRILGTDYWYVYVWDEGFFEPTSLDRGNGTYEYGLEPAEQSQALDYVAVSSEDASTGVRRALETGQFRTSDPLDDADELVAHDGSYYVVTATSYSTTDGERRDIVVALQWIAGIAGGWLVLQGQRLRVAGTG